MAYLIGVLKMLVWAALCLVTVIMLTYCSMYFVDDEGSVMSECHYDQKLKRNVAVEHYKVENGQRVPLPLNQAECLKAEIGNKKAQD